MPPHTVVQADASATSDVGFSGWRVVVIAAAALAMSAPGQTVGVSVFVDPMIDSLGLTRAQMSGAYLVGTLTGALALPMVGTWIDRFGVRIATAVIAGLFGGVLVAMAGVTGLLMLAVGFAGVRLLGQGSLTLASTTAVSLSFSERRGVALGVASAAGAAVMSLLPLVLAASIGTFQWRLTWSLAGLAVWLIVVPLAWFGLRDRAASVARHAPARPAADAAPVALDTAVNGWTRAEAMRTLMFWTVSAAVGVSGLIATGLAFHQISLLGERGLTVGQAAANFLPQTAAAIVGTLTMGVLVDRIAPRLLVAASMASIAGALVLAQVARPGWSAIAFGVAVGAGGGSIRTLEAAAFPRYFGVEHVGAIRGMVLALTVGGTAFGPLLLALGFERFGSYGPVLSALLILPAGIAAVAVFAPVPDGELRQRVRGRMADRAGRRP